MGGGITRPDVLLAQYDVVDPPDLIRWGFKAVGAHNMAVRQPEVETRSMLDGIAVEADIFRNRASFIRAARTGVRGELARNAVATLGRRELFAKVLQTSPANLSRCYHRKSLTPAQSEGLLDTLRLFDYAGRVFGAFGKVQAWLDAEVPALGNLPPAELLDTFEGRALVKEALDKIEYGEFS